MPDIVSGIIGLSVLFGSVFVITRCLCLSRVPNPNKNIVVLTKEEYDTLINSLSSNEKLPLISPPEYREIDVNKSQTQLDV